MTSTRALPLACFALLTAPFALSQQPPAAAPAGKGMDRHMSRDMHEGGGMGIVPPGMWWKNPATITSLTLTPEQQKKLDDTFLQSRISLIHLHASLEEEQLKLEPLLNVNPPDQARALAQISKVADLRAELEKTDAKMLLSLRSVLTADQWTKLQADQHARHERMDRTDRPDPMMDRRGEGRGEGRGKGGPQGPAQPPPLPPA